MDKQEKIVCAAVQITYKDGIGDYAIDVICDATYKLIRQNQSYKRQHFVHASTAKDTDGFRTNYGRFVDAKEAEIIAGLAGQIWIDNGKHNLSSIQFEKSLKTMKESGIDSIKLRFPSSDGYYFIDHIIGNGLKPEDLY